MTEKYKNGKLDIETRVNDLIKRMTIDEKIDQMFTIGCNQLGELIEKMENGEIRNISATYQVAGFSVDDYNRLQALQLKNSRLGIPLILHGENLHGVRHPLATVFPTNGCLAATFNEKLAGEVANATAKEARSLGITQLYAPNIDIPWEIRWGRTEENFGEDPYLTSVMGVQMVKGFQKNKVAATIKHYLAYGIGEGGLNLATAHVGEREVREYMLPPFAACIQKGKAWAIMPSYNEIDGVPVHASPLWMQQVLRKELGFDGVAVTDYGASDMLRDMHHVVDTPLEAGKILCDNEIDMEACGYFGYNDEFRALVKAGKYPISKIDRCVKNILRLKFRLGLFEQPYIPREDCQILHSEATVRLARKVAEQGIVLLKNDGILPLNGKEKIALIGPNADVAQLGNYVAYDYKETCYSGRYVAEEALTLKQVFADSDKTFAFEAGCDYHRTDEASLERAIEIAKAADVVIMALGDNSKDGVCGGRQEELVKTGKTNKAVTSGEGYDVTSVELTQAQKTLFNKIAALGKPIITILYGGRPHAIAEESEKSSAILFAFGPGEEGNPVLFDMLYGRVNPSGKLPISFPSSSGAIPCFYNYKPSARGGFYHCSGSLDAPGRDYVFDSPKALYPFGYGLSYTQFSYSNLTVERLGNYRYKVSVDVENTGNRDGEESVLLFLSAQTQPITPVVKKLRAFCRLSVSRGEKQRASFVLRRDDFSYIGYDYKKKSAKTLFRVCIGDQEGVIDTRSDK